MSYQVTSPFTIILSIRPIVICVPYLYIYPNKGDSSLGVDTYQTYLAIRDLRDRVRKKEKNKQ